MGCSTGVILSVVKVFRGSVALFTESVKVGYGFWLDLVGRLNIKHV